METLTLANQKVRDYLIALTRSGHIKNHQDYTYQRLDKINQTEELSCWQEPPEDVIYMIVQRMNLSDRVRLSCFCKSWRSVSMRRNMSALPQLPWLLIPQPLTSNNSLRFSSLSEGKVFNLRLPKPTSESKLSTLVQTCLGNSSRFYTSSKGWLVLLKLDSGLRIEPDILLFLVNPISGAQHQLPSLALIPSKEPYNSSVDGVVLSSPDISQCFVAALANGRQLFLCRTRDKSWSVVQVFDESGNDGKIVRIMFSSTGMLYALVKDTSNVRVDANRTLKVGDHEVKLVLIYYNMDSIPPEGESLIHHQSYLVKSTNNEVLLIHQIYDFPRTDVDVNGEDIMEGNDINEEGDEIAAVNYVENECTFGCGTGRIFEKLTKAIQWNPFSDDHDDEEDVTVHVETRCFNVYKIDPDKNNISRVQNLGDEILFLAEDGSAMSLLASDFKEVQGNCIYFAARGYNLDTLRSSADIGIFDLDTGRIERTFATVKMPRYSILSWFTPSLW